MIDVVRQLRTASVFAFALCAVVACEREQRGPNGELVLHGTVHMVSSDSGGTCWKFESKQGKSYELQPAQVPHELLVDGATAVVMAKPREGGSFCNVGQIVDVVKADSISGPASTASR